MMRLVSSILYITVVLLLLWGLLSGVEVLLKNAEKKPHYCEYNIFYLIQEESKC